MIVELSGANVLVVGLKKSGMASAELLLRHGASVSLTDLKALEELPCGPEFVARLGLPFRRQSAETFEGYGLIVISPDVPADLPQLEAARQRGTPVVGEVELAAPFLQGRTIGITGSNGKTTTTSLIGHILQYAGIVVQVGGNIGTPVTAMVETSRRWLERAGAVQFSVGNHRRISRAYRPRAQRDAEPPRPSPHFRALRRRQGPAVRDHARRRHRHPQCR
jgi:UDP-N-acetylmuramoylalanine-D-glutamate ligase